LKICIKNFWTAAQEDDNKAGSERKQGAELDIESIKRKTRRGNDATN